MNKALPLALAGIAVASAANPEMFIRFGSGKDTATVGPFGSTDTVARYTNVDIPDNGRCYRYQSEQMTGASTQFSLVFRGDSGAISLRNIRIQYLNRRINILPNCPYEGAPFSECSGTRRVETVDTSLGTGNYSGKYNGVQFLASVAFAYDNELNRGSWYDSLEYQFVWRHGEGYGGGSEWQWKKKKSIVNDIICSYRYYGGFYSWQHCNTEPYTRKLDCQDFATTCWSARDTLEVTLDFVDIPKEFIDYGSNDYWWRPNQTSIFFKPPYPKYFVSQDQKFYDFRGRSLSKLQDNRIQIRKYKKEVQVR